MCAVVFQWLNLGRGEGVAEPSRVSRAKPRRQASQAPTERTREIEKETEKRTPDENRGKGIGANYTQQSNFCHPAQPTESLTLDSSSW
jgi:hypothetical protein